MSGGVVCKGYFVLKYFKLSACEVELDKDVG